MSAQQKNSNNQDDETVTKNIDYEVLCKYIHLKQLITMFTSHNPNPCHNFINFVFHHNIKCYIEIHIVKIIQDIEHEFKQIDKLEDVEEIKKCSLKIFRNFNIITEKYKEVQNIFLNLTETNSRSCSIEDINKVKNRFREYDVEVTINVNFPGLLSCFKTLENEIEKQQTKAENELKYYQGKEKTFLGQFQYWTLGWVAWTYNWCKYKTKVNAYQSFLTVFIDPLRTYISSRKRDISTAKIHIKQLVKVLNDCKNKFPDNLDSDNCLENVSPEVINNNLNDICKVFEIINPSTATIYSCLKIPDQGAGSST